jgi:hypothetical protein
MAWRKAPTRQEEADMQARRAAFHARVAAKIERDRICFARVEHAQKVHAALVRMDADRPAAWAGCVIEAEHRA